jgi:hypothetical protein
MGGVAGTVLLVVNLLRRRFQAGCMPEMSSIFTGMIHLNEVSEQDVLINAENSVASCILVV